MVQISNVITIVGMLVPFVSYGFVSCMAAFALLGIGNTIIQVALNPLLASVVKGDALTSSLTAGQVVKAVSSFLGPFIAAFCRFGVRELAISVSDLRRDYLSVCTLASGNAY